MLITKFATFCDTKNMHKWQIGWALALWFTIFRHGTMSDIKLCPLINFVRTVCPFMPSVSRSFEYYEPTRDAVHTTNIQNAIYGACSNIWALQQN